MNLGLLSLSFQGHCHTPPVLASLEGSTQPEPTAGAGQAHQGVAPLPVTDTQPLLGGQGETLSIPAP